MSKISINRSAVPMSGLDLKPLNPLKKPLPLTPHEFYRVSVLEYENKMLRMNNSELQAQVQVLAHQVQHHQQVAEAARAYVKTTSASIRRMQDATNRMNGVEIAARKGWNEFCAKEEILTQVKVVDIVEQQFI